MNDKPSLMPVWDHKTFEAIKKTSTRISVRIIRVNGEGTSHIRRPTTPTLWRWMWSESKPQKKGMPEKNSARKDAASLAISKGISKRIVHATTEKEVLQPHTYLQQRGQPILRNWTNLKEKL